MMYTADTSKVGSQISGEPVERRKLREQRRSPKFDVPNLEVSKVYKLLLERGYTERLLQQLGNYICQQIRKIIRQIITTL
ncbi:MAG: palindromic element RPE5 domain-containing protein [Rickettsia conorii subsp. raoultii]|uniref:palindromic element RPE5 domain-containing protein n=1 Tax=Rickettsia conorii TaxID=781 RepID=UPI00398BAF66